MKGCRNGLIIAGCMLCLAGCQESARSPGDNWLLVSFEKDVSISYRMVSERETEIDLTTGDPKKKSRPQLTTEKLELVMVYTPVEVDPFGLTVLDAKCVSAKVTRSAFSGKRSVADAMEGLTGQRFILKLTPTGKIADDSDLRRIAAKLGKASFSKGKNDSRIKNPDMITDFLAMQRHLWDTSATVPNPQDLDIGDHWQADQLIPWPVPVYPPPGRTTTYTLDSISTVENQPRMATINSTYAISQTPTEAYIRPYEKGKFQMRGMFGFLRGFQFKHIEGAGTQVFNLDDGLVESDRQQYQLDVTARFMLPLGDSLPVLKVNQTVSIERIEASQ